MRVFEQWADVTWGPIRKGAQHQAVSSCAGADGSESARDSAGRTPAKRYACPQRAADPANLLGLPSACVPAGRDDTTGLPIGVLLSGHRLREDQCPDAAEAIEAQLGLKTPIDPVL